MIFRTQLEKADKHEVSLTNLMTQQKGLADTLNVTNLKLCRDLHPTENPPQRDGRKLFPTPESQKSDGPLRRIATWSEWPASHQSTSRQLSYDNSPSLREFSKTPEERYPPKDLDQEALIQGPILSTISTWSMGNSSGMQESRKVEAISFSFFCFSLDWFC